MSRPTVFLATLLAILAGPALAAWSPGEKEVDFATVVGDVRDGIADWKKSEDLDDGTIAILKAADKILAKAEGRWDEPEWIAVCRSLDGLEDSLRLLAIARRANRKSSDFRDFVDGAAEAFYGLAKDAALSAADYVNDNFDTKKGTRKLLRAGGKTTKAARAVKADKPKYAKGIRLCVKAIAVLGKAGLLDDAE